MRRIALVPALTIAAGGLAFVGSCGLTAWSFIEHGFSPEPVFGLGVLLVATAAGVLAHFQRKAWAAIACALIALPGLGIVTLQGLTRLAESRDTKSLTAQVSLSEYEELTKEASRLRGALTEAEKVAARACKSAPDPLPAKGWTGCKLRRADVHGLQSRLDGVKLEAEEAKGSLKPINAQADQIGAMFGGEAARVFAVAQPVFVPVFFELAAAFLFIAGFAGVHPQSVKKAYALPQGEKAPAKPANSTPSDDEGEKKPTPKDVIQFPRPRVLHSVAEIPDHELEALRLAFAVGDGPISNDELARRMNVVKSEASKRVQKGIAAGILHKQRVGREVAIRLN
jgi:predicted DNA-binding protein (UPF0251 family)